MTRDYKTKRARRSGFSGWSGLLVGLAIGLGMAGILYWKDHRPNPAVAAPAKAAKGKSRTVGSQKSAGAEASVATPAKSYDFYKMLPSFEVVVPKKTKDVRPDIHLAPESRPGTYILQAGSYKNFADADRVRAQLALQGIESKVQKVSVDNDTWHRIRIGPVSNLQELNRMRDILRKANIDVLVIRVGA